MQITSSFLKVCFIAGLIAVSAEYFLPRDASAERGNATVSRLSVCLSVRDV